MLQIDASAIPVPNPPLNHVHTKYRLNIWDTTWHDLSPSKCCGSKGLCTAPGTCPKSLRTVSFAYPSEVVPRCPDLAPDRSVLQWRPWNTHRMRCFVFLSIKMYETSWRHFAFVVSLKVSTKVSQADPSTIYGSLRPLRRECWEISAMSPWSSHASSACGQPDDFSEGGWGRSIDLSKLKWQFSGNKWNTHIIWDVHTHTPTRTHTHILYIYTPRI